jgi:transcriptional regulator with PAS, ATPase and Fis domain
MNMQKVKILAIAPYEGIQTLIRQVAEKMTNVEVTVFVGDLAYGAEIARQYTEADFDVIVSRGGTAELIRQQTSLPVVEIPLSVYDILRSIKLAENYNSKYAIIGFPSATKNAHFLCDVLRYNIDIYTIHTETEAHESLKKLSQNGYTMVLCDMITNTLAQRYGISSILITSGTESVEAALNQAVQTSVTYHKLTNRINFFRTVLEDQQKLIHVYTADNELVYSFGAYALPPAVVEKMTSNIQLVLVEKKKHIYLETSGYLFTILGICRTINEQLYVIYYVHERKMTLNLGKNGISYISKEDAFDEFFNSIYGIMQSAFFNDMTMEKYAQSSQPLMVIGEVGTGKEQMTRLIYAKSQFSDRPLITIDCSRLHERGWSFLLENDNSPLSNSNNTIYFKNIKFLSEPQFAELTAALKDLNVHQRNRLLFTYSYNEQEGYSERYQTIINLFSCLTLTIPPLRMHKSDIPNFASLYISILNMKLAKEMIGFEPEALASLEAYDWPYNIDQFKRVINELVTIADSPYIKLSSVTKLLCQEMQMVCPAVKPVNTSLNINRTLQEINYDILHQVIADENGNQSAAARRLGISRTTLWRMLQNSEALSNKESEK